MKFFAVINKKQPLTSQLNAIAHTALGLSLKYPMDSIGYSEFTDVDGNSVSYLTDAPFIILTAKNSNQLRVFQKELITRKLPQSAFYTNMIDGGSVKSQVENINASGLEDLEYVAVVTFGDNDQIGELTRKFSLYKNPTTVK